MTFADKVAIVTGGASGIGAATAARLSALGMTVVVADVDAGGSRSVADEIGCSFARLDVGDIEAWELVLASVVADHGGVDVAFLNAGVMTRPASEPLNTDPIPWLTPEGYRRVVGVNVDGVANGVMATIPHLEAGGGGAIVMTASMVGLIPQSQDPFYAMTKHAVVGLARSLGPALKSRSISVNAICPGYVDTGIIAPDMKESGPSLAPPAYIAESVVTILESGVTGGVWVAGHPAEPVWRYEFAPATEGPPIT